MHALTVFYDGLCPLCSREIEHYRRQPGSERIAFVDITAAEFDASTEGLDPKAVHRHLHAKDWRGDLHVGVAAFIAIWNTLPRYRWAAALAGKPFLRPALDVGYAAFARIRPWLPRARRAECASSPYCELR